MGPWTLREIDQNADLSNGLFSVTLPQTSLEAPLGLPSSISVACIGFHIGLGEGNALAFGTCALDIGSLKRFEAVRDKSTVVNMLIPSIVQARATADAIPL